MAEENVCIMNRTTVKRIYTASLFNNDPEDSTFDQFLIENFDEVCSVGDVSTYEEGKIK